MNLIKLTIFAVASQFVLAQTAQAHYDPNIGRWISRDPIGESGGVNLYGFVSNQPLDRIDLLGLDKLTLKYDLTDDSNYDRADENKYLAGYLKNLINVRPFVDGAGASFSAVLENAKTKVGKYDPEGKDCNCIKLLIFVTHGTGGNISPYDQREFIQANRLGRGPKERQRVFEDQLGVKALRKFAALLCKDGKVRFTTCKAGEDPLLQIELEKAGIPLIDLNQKDGSMMFGVPVREIEGVPFPPSKKGQ